MERKDVFLPAGIKVGNYGEGNTGVTVILAADGATAGASVRGGAPGTRETDLLRSEKAMQHVNAVVLSGGSAYGLGACGGVMEYLKDEGKGYKIGGKVVPIVPGAVIYDLNFVDYEYPKSDWGYRAAANAKDYVETGKVGAGTGATVGKIRGPQFSSAGGLGAATVNVMGVNVTAIMVVNAMGDVFGADGKVIAGAKGNDGEFIDTEKCILEGDFLKLMPPGANTTIGCIITDAALTKLECNKLAEVAHNGLARSIRPVHTDHDGDTLFVLSSGNKPVSEFTLLTVAAVEAVSRAIRNAVAV